MSIYHRIVIVGLGLIGGSMAKAAKAKGGCQEIFAYARNVDNLKYAKKEGIIDEYYTDLDELFGLLGKDDLVVVGVPTLTVPDIFRTIKRSLSDLVTVTDVASVKGSVRQAAIDVFGEVPSQFVLGHPIAGSEQVGVRAAKADLYQNRRVILTPLETTDVNRTARLKLLWEAFGAEVIEMDIDEHDVVLAATSHLPHVLAYSLVDTLAHDSENENIFRYAAGGFRDFTRIASSDPVMWHDIVFANKEALLEAIGLFQLNLETLTSSIKNDDSESIMGIFTRAKSARDHFVKMLAGKAYIEPIVENMQDNTEFKTIEFEVSYGGCLKGEIKVAGDKSISHRSIMLGALAEGVTKVHGFLEGEDALATLQAFREMGVVIEGPEDGEVIIHGVGLNGLKAPAGPLYLGNSGTSMRLLSGLLAGQAFSVTLTGDESLSKRPMNRIANPLREMGAKIDTEAEGRPPLVIHGGQKLKGIDYNMPMASAQVKSCVLLAGLYAEGKTSVKEPAPTRDHTERMLKGFGVDVSVADSVATLIDPSPVLTASTIEVPSDISSATFFMVGAAIAPGSDILLKHVGINPTRIGVINILKLMGADLTLSNESEVGGEPVADIRVRYAPLKGIHIPESDVPLAIDEFPALFVAAACAEGTTVLTGAEELRVKESDRIQVMADGLAILGVNVKPTPDGIEIVGGSIGGGEVESHGDHRIAMSFAMAALRATGDIRIKDCANVATSFPNFVALAQECGLGLKALSIS